jgi:hypothetical protein
MAAVDLQQSISTIQQNTNSQINMPALQSFGEAETFLGEHNAPHTETAQELGFDDLFDWVKYDGDMSCDYDWTIPSSETPAIFSGYGGASDTPDFGTSVRASDPWEGRAVDLRRWQNLIIQKKEQEAEATLAKAFKKVDNRGLLFVTPQQLCLPTRPKSVTRLHKSPAVVTPGKGNLKALWKANFDNEEEEEEEEIEGSEPSNRKGKAKGKAKTSESSSQKESPSGKKRKRTAYPTPPSSGPSSSSSSGSPSDDEDDDSDSDSDDDDMGHPSKAQKGHKSGFDRKTGRLTLVGRFPPEIAPDGKFQCRDPVCKATNGMWMVGTRNGYKYHLKNVCLGNPDSVQSLRRAAGQGSQKTGNGLGYSQKCDDCGKTFKCEEGFRKHREENPSTKDGKCRERRQRLEIGESVETAIPLE